MIGQEGSNGCRQLQHPGLGYGKADVGAKTRVHQLPPNPDLL